MKTRKRGILGTAAIVALTLALALSLGACGGSGTDGASSDGGEAKTGALKIGYDNLGTDWILMEYQDSAEDVTKLDNADNEFSPINGNYNTDTTQTGIQNLISAGIDGLVYLPTFQTLTPLMMEMCETAGVDFVGFCHTPAQGQFELFETNPRSAGFIGSSCYQIGYQMGELAIENGGKVAIVQTGSEGLIDMDLRKDGFVDAFEKGGGEVVGISRAANPQEVISHFSDVLTAHPEADTAYGVTGVSGVGVTAALRNFNRTDIKLYCTDLEPDMLDSIRDGSITAGDGGSAVQSMLATCALINKIKGHQILKDGKPPVTEELPSLIITPETVDVYQQLFVDSSPFTDEMIKNLLYEYNPDVSWADYQEWIDNYSFDWLLEQQ